MPAKKVPAPKLTKQEKQQQSLDEQLSRIPTNSHLVKNEEEAAIRFMYFSLLSDIQYRRKKDMDDLLPPDDMAELIRGLAAFNSAVTGPSSVAMSDASTARFDPSIEKHIYEYNYRLIASMKSKEIEIEDGEKCLACGKMSAKPRNVQLRSGDEGTGRVLVCTNRDCKAVRVLNRG